MGEPQVTVYTIERAAAELRAARRRLTAQSAGRSLQERAVSALSHLAECWRDPEYPVRRQAERENAGFPFPMVWVSLQALLASFDRNELWRLIDSESVRGCAGPEVIGHVIASNTPLLGWTSLARALLVQSASFVKLPSHPVAAWAGYFHQTLSEIDPEIADLVRLMHWKGGARDLDGALGEHCDEIIAYGSDETIAAIRALLPAGKPLIDYGHRVSFGLVEAGADENNAAHGFARDILLYDQGGCLSPHCIFVQGGFAEAVDFASRLAQALAVRAGEPEHQLARLATDPARAARVREARSLARMEPGAKLWEDESLRWTVIVQPETRFFLSPTHGVVYVAPLLGKILTDVLAGMPFLQGAAVGTASENGRECWERRLAACEVSYICAPGELQRPALGWRENGKPVLRSLLADLP